MDEARSGRFDLVPRHGMLDEARLAELTGEQDRVVSRDQLAFLGADRHVVAHRVASGRWTAVGPRVVLLCTGTPTFRQRLWVATLHSGPRSALAGLTAAEADGLHGFATSALHTVVPHGSDAADLVDPTVGVTVRVHQSRRLADRLVHPVRVPRRLLLPEALVDSASGALSDDRARLLLIAAVQQRLLRAADLRDVVSRRPRLPRPGSSGCGAPTGRGTSTRTFSRTASVWRSTGRSTRWPGRWPTTTTDATSWVPVDD